MMRKWLLPEHVEDILPPEALRIESLRARLLQVFRSFGYELVMPPMLEYIESLLTGTGHDLDLRTFKLIDQISGRTMGVRADMTPQVARIDAHLLNRAGVTRLCYCGTVLHTRPRGFTSTREPLQIGAEIYGHAGIESDIEMQRLLRAALSAAGLAGVWKTVQSVKMLWDRIGHLANRVADHRQDIIAEHEAIVSALDRNDEQAARKAMKIHLHSVFNAVARLRPHHEDYFTDA